MCARMAKNLIFGAARETRTLMNKIHTALNRACLPISAWPQNDPHLNNDNYVSN